VAARLAAGTTRSVGLVRRFENLKPRDLFFSTLALLLIGCVPPVRALFASR